MNKREYLAKRKEIEAECRQKLTILDQAFQLFGGTPVGSKNGSTFEAGTPSEWNQPVSKREAIRTAVKRIPGSFSLKEVKTVIQEQYGAGVGDNQLSAVLSRMAKKGDLDLVKKKAGKAPAVYANKAG
jgi:hypothetical protein